MRYFYYWYQCFTESDSIKILNDIEHKLGIYKNNFIDYGAEGKNVTDVKILESKYLSPLMDTFFSRVEIINEMYFGFNLFNKRPISVHLNYYKNDNKSNYPFHRDGQELGTMSDIKLTAILNLSRNPYKGGNFKMLLHSINPEEVPQINTTGCILVFPSYILHQVDPVVDGERITLSTWFSGPNWK